MFIIQKTTQNYDEMQDRISLTVQNAEGEVLLLWLTQRLLNRLTKPLANILDDELKTVTTGRSIPGLHAFEQKAAQALQKPQKPVLPNAVLTEVLVTSIDISRTSNMCRITFKWDANGAATVSLSSIQLRQFLGILYRLVDMAEWPQHAWPEWFTAKPAGAESQAPILLH